MNLWNAFQTQLLLGWLLALVGVVCAFTFWKLGHDAEADALDSDAHLEKQVAKMRELEQANHALREKAEKWERLEERGCCVTALYEAHHQKQPRCPVQVLQTLHHDRVAAWPVHLN